MSFKTIIGQDRAILFLKRGLSQDRLSPALLFAGPAGIGKRRVARELAKTFNCLSVNGWSGRVLEEIEPCDRCASCRKVEGKIHPDVWEMDFARQAEWLQEKAEKQTAIKIELVRKIEREASFKASEGRVKVIILDPAQDMTEEASNALLKILEEPPAGVGIILISHDETALFETIRSRCTVVRFRRIPTPEIAAHLERELHLTFEEAHSIARRAVGSLGQAMWEKEWADWKIPAFEEMDLPSAFKWLEQFDSRQGGRSAAQVLISILLHQECDRLKNGEAEGPERLRILLGTSLALNQNVSPRLALEAMYLRLGEKRASF